MTDRPIDRVFRDLAERVESIDQQKAFAFSILCVERNLGLYNRYCQLKNDMRAKDILYANIEEAVRSEFVIDAQRIRQIRRELGEVRPDQDAEEDLIVEVYCAWQISVAADCAFACLDPSEQRATKSTAASYVLDAVRGHLVFERTGDTIDFGSDPRGAELDYEFLRGGPIRDELNCQLQDLDDLEESRFDVDLINKLVERARNNKFTLEGEG